MSVYGSPGGHRKVWKRSRTDRRYPFTRTETTFPLKNSGGLSE